MIYYLIQLLNQQNDVPGSALWEAITFRAALALITSLLIGLFFGKKAINYLRVKQLGETVRELGLTGQKEKEGTPTMGGIIIIIATLIPVLLFAKWNIYVILLVFSMLWMGTIGGLDDYIKVFKKNKDGLAGKFKVLGQITLGLIVGCALYFHPQVTIKEKITPSVNIENNTARTLPVFSEAKKSTQTNIPFIKDNTFDYSDVLFFMSEEDAEKYAWIIFIPMVIFIITAVSNGANLTDGIDGLAAGTSAIIVACIMIFAWVSGNIILSDYLNIMYIPNIGEVAVFSSALIGGIVGFMWYNTYPAQIFMGDTGSLTLGGLIAVLAIIVRKELLIPVLCGIFLAENLSVMLQVAWFKYTKNKYGEGRRIFLMSPLHHHFQKKGYHESKIVNRFLIVGILLAVISIVTLKIR
ncbi:MAG: phospho-N-acetylmuramoyl-pentapeptide-transferase [Flavobacteriaceae bacterium]|nr:MAG: phospho-N-acetylmuramoyl-pentapeptide-transferase [Flavobacteriaceae bacterium]